MRFTFFRKPFFIALLSVPLWSTSFYACQSRQDQLLVQAKSELTLPQLKQRAAQDQDNNPLQAGDDAYHAKDYKTALAHYQKMSADDPQYLLRVGLCYWMLHDLAQAESHFDRLYQPKTSLLYLEAAWCLSLVYLEQNNFQKAQPLLQEVLEKRTRNSAKAKELLQAFGGQ
jgi:tetratricopeptide (TPR) repeat protein